MDIEKMQKKAMAIGIPVVVVIILLLMLNPFVTVGAGERGVVMNFGAVQDKVLDEGLHFIIPLVQEVEKVDVKIRKGRTKTVAASSDMQDVSSEVAVNYHIIPDRANIVYQKIGIHFKERIIDPAVKEVIKAVTARYTAEELITKRQNVSDDIKKALSDRLLNHNIAVDELSIEEFSFSSKFTEAIEAKQVAEQKALQAKRDLDRIKIEKQQKITRAEAEAESLRLQRQMITPQLIELRKIEATMKAIEKWDGHLPSVTGGTVPFIDVKTFNNNKR